jgi:hypothetical protein
LFNLSSCFRGKFPKKYPFDVYARIYLFLKYKTLFYVPEILLIVWLLIYLSEYIGFYMVFMMPLVTYLRAFDLLDLRKLFHA